MAEYDTQLLGVLLGLAGLRGVEHGGLDAAGERLAEQLRGELDGSRDLLEVELPARLPGHGGAVVLAALAELVRLPGWVLR